MLVKDKFIIDASIINTLQHDDIPNNFTGHESILHFLIRNKVIEPILSEFWDTTHLEEIWRFHISTDSLHITLSTLRNLADLILFAHTIGFEVHIFMGELVAGTKRLPILRFN